MSTRVATYVENGLAVIRQRIRATVEAIRNDTAVDRAHFDADAAAVFAVGARHSFHLRGFASG
jgi:hypothetical protein